MSLLLNSQLKENVRQINRAVCNLVLAKTYGEVTDATFENTKTQLRAVRNLSFRTTYILETLQTKSWALFRNYGTAHPIINPNE